MSLIQAFTSIVLWTYVTCFFASGSCLLVTLVGLLTVLIYIITNELTQFLLQLIPCIISFCTMERLAEDALASLTPTDDSPHVDPFVQEGDVADEQLVPTEEKLRHLTALKQAIKHRSCPSRAVPTIFDVIRHALTIPHLFDAGFSILGHLNRRLLLQNVPATIHSHTVGLLPVLLERLGDQRDRVRERAMTAVSDYYSVCDDAVIEIERFIRDSALTSRNPRAKISAMHWVLKVRALAHL